MGMIKIVLFFFGFSTLDAFPQQQGGNVQFRGPPCGLPPFASQLTTGTQQKLAQIWNGYQQGTDCRDKIGQTIALFQSVRATEPNLPPPPPQFGGPPCGLPPFAAQLSTGPQQQLTQIWNGYQPGTDCRDRHVQTKTVLENMSQADKAALPFRMPAPGATPGLPPCGLPPFASFLSTESQRKLTEIWGRYQQGQDCTQQHIATKAFLDTMSAEEWAKLPPPPAFGPSSQSSST